MNNERIEYTILRNLIFNEDYTRKVLPFINEIFFTKREEQILFQEINTFVFESNLFAFLKPIKIFIPKKQAIILPIVSINEAWNTKIYGLLILIWYRKNNPKDPIMQVIILIFFTFLKWPNPDNIENPQFNP